jgi:hypothetical protein
MIMQDNYSTNPIHKSWSIVTAKWAGALGNTLRVSICASSAAFSSNLTVTDSLRANAVGSGETTININGSANAAANLQSGDLVSFDGGTSYIRVASVNATAIIVASAPGVVVAGVPIYVNGNMLTNSVWLQAHLIMQLLLAVLMMKCTLLLLTKMANSLMVLLTQFLKNLHLFLKASDAKFGDGSTNYYVNVLINAQDMCGGLSCIWQFWLGYCCGRNNI